MKKQRNAGYLIWIFIVLLLWGAGLHYAAWIRENYSAVSLRFENQILTRRMVEEGLKTDQDNGEGQIPEVTLWQTREAVGITNPQLKRGAWVNLYEVSGSMEQTLPQSYLSGNAAYEKDGRGCVLDHNTAYELFGTYRVEGLVIRCNGKDYRIRGVIRTQKRVMLIQNTDKDTGYSNAELVFPNGGKEERGILAERFLERHLWEEPEIMVDGNLFAGLSHTVSMLPAWFLAIVSLILIIRRIARLRPAGIFAGGEKWRMVSFLAGKCILSAGLSLLFLWYVNFELGLPDSFIPTKWSDFRFYSVKYQEVMEALEQFFGARIMTKDWLLAKNVLFCAMFSIYGVIAGGIFMYMGTVREKRKGRGLWWELASVLAAAVLFLFWEYKSGQISGLPMSFPGILAAAILAVRLGKKENSGKETELRH